ncbi:hypothetical protein BpHYR1_024894 [Brachionus plicatilis]|uniref:Uncharacterized protein n=1 Tax=Brachionus plicatilis TaxID=10195 RepID=A0A3M7PG20_BRAPC|nr:hypothetical protein BpHYR1_024894 [Brachionus plicatilis]
MNRLKIQSKSKVIEFVEYEISFNIMLTFFYFNCLVSLGNKSPKKNSNLNENYGHLIRQNKLENTSVNLIHELITIKGQERAVLDMKFGADKI